MTMRTEGVIRVRFHDAGLFPVHSIEGILDE